MDWKYTFFQEKNIRFNDSDMFCLNVFYKAGIARVFFGNKLVSSKFTKTDNNVTKVKKIDFDSPIIPGKGIGEIRLLDNAFSLRQLILSNTLSGQHIDWTEHIDRMLFKI